MPDGQVLEFTRVTKRFNDVTAVSDFSARVEPGVVTAFLGPNGAGKTTTLRILLGQVRATSGTATIGGVAYPELRHPLRTIGSVLEETMYRPRRSASRQLTIAAKANGIPLSRVDEVLSLVGLEHESEGRIGSFSLGMRQRLSVAHALLGDPGALVFDEPANGLDPEGIRWMRLLMRRLADEGRTVLVSSHVLSEIEQVADHVLVLSKGQLMLSSGIEKLADPSAGSVVVDAADRVALTSALASAGFDVEVLRSGLTVRGGTAGTVGAIAASAGIALSTLVQRGPTLEDVFIELVRGGTLAPRAVEAASQYMVATDSTDGTAPDAAGTADDAPLGAVPAFGAVPSVDAAAAVETPSGEAKDDTDGDSGLPDSDSAAAAAAADAADVEADAAADAAAAADAVEYAAAELGYAAAASDANDAEDAADVISEAADRHVDEEPKSDGDAAGASTEREDAAGAARPSFDEILFGTAAPSEARASAESAESAQDASDAGADEARTDSAAEDGPIADAESVDEHSGVEFFTELNGSDESDASAVDADTDIPADASDDDPRSAAVSSMLAAAARAYYEDEPKDYPLGDAEAGEAEPGEGQGGETPADVSESGAEPDGGAPWTVASTGVIDQVPLAADEDASNEDASHEDASHEDASNEDASNEVGDGGQQRDGEHHDGEHNDGEHHDGEHGHHDGETDHHDGEHEHHEGEHHQS